jgi:hypothetical protein
VKLEILSVPDCPNVARLQPRLAVVLAGREDVTVTTDIINTFEQAVARGMNGSPTLLLDGVDPFAEHGQTPSVSCRLYRDVTGHPTGAPSVTQLRAALDGCGTPVPAGTVVDARVEQDCCSPAAGVASVAAEGLRVWRARTPACDPAARAVHQAILRAFATTGKPPTDAALEQVAVAAGATVGPTLVRLHDADVIRLDRAGAIAVAYPFSAVPTRPRVRLASGFAVWAMCAIDALGIPPMLDTDATITSVDPVTDQPVTVTVHDHHYAWDPAAAVVFYSAAAGTGPSAESCCNALNAFTSSATAEAWMQAHPSVRGELLDVTTAELVGRHIFGALLDRVEDHRRGGSPVRAASNPAG